MTPFTSMTASSKPIVFVCRLSESIPGLVSQIGEAAEMIGIGERMKSARKVFIKPNLTYPAYKTGVTTRKEFVEALVTGLRKFNPVTKIYIGDGEGGYNSFSMSEALRTMGYYKIAEKVPNVEIVNLSLLPRQTVKVEVKGQAYPLELPALFDDVDFSITCPVPKVHCMTGVTLSYKNQWGCVPDTMRLKNHFVFDEIIAQICDNLRFRYAFLDGKYGLDDNGPIMGRPVEVNWFVASNSLGAFDMLVSEMMGFNWQKIGHLRTATAHGYMPKREDIDVVGDIGPLKRKFILRRNVWNYPAMAAFHSSSLTQLVYFSRWSKIIHDLMYTFRARPIEK